MNLCEVTSITERGSIFKFSDHVIPDRGELLDSLPIRFLALERKICKTNGSNNEQDFWDGLLLAHPLTKDRVGDDVISLFHCLRVSSIFDWQVLLQCPTTMDVTKGIKVTQLSETSIEELMLQVGNKKPRNSKIEGRTPLLQAYVRLSLTLRSNAIWHGK